MALYDAVLIDLETNGLLNNCSIVQFSAFFLRAGEIKKVINRYYFSREKINPEAVRIHGLTPERIAFLRAKQKATYPKYFEEDDELLNLLKKVFPQSYLIGYNTNFERRFLRARGILIERNIDILQLYTPILGIFHEYYGWKYPKLDEAVQIVYKLLYNKVLFRDKHNALVDVYKKSAIHPLAKAKGFLAEKLDFESFC